MHTTRNKLEMRKCHVFINSMQIYNVFLIFILSSLTQKISLSTFYKSLQSHEKQSSSLFSKDPPNNGGNFLQKSTNMLVGYNCLTDLTISVCLTFDYQPVNFIESKCLTYQLLIGRLVVLLVCQSHTTLSYQLVLIHSIYIIYSWHFLDPNYEVQFACVIDAQDQGNTSSPSLNSSFFMGLNFQGHWPYMMTL